MARGRFQFSLLTLLIESVIIGAFVAVHVRPVKITSLQPSADNHMTVKYENSGWPLPIFEYTDLEYSPVTMRAEDVVAGRKRIWPYVANGLIFLSFGLVAAILVERRARLRNEKPDQF